MYYFYVRHVEGFGDSLILLGTEKGNPTTLFLKQPSLLASLQKDFSGAKFIWFPDCSIPLISIGNDAADGVEYKNVSDVRNYFNKGVAKYGKADEKLMNFLAQKMVPKYDVATSTFLMKLLIQEEQMLSEGLNFPFSLGEFEMDFESVPESRHRLEEWNSKFRSAFSELDDIENVTLKMEKPDSEVFIRIPDRVGLQYEGGPAKFIPKRSEVFNAYGNTKAAYKQGYQSVVPRHMIAIIEGDRSKNGLAIQENEKKYYNALCTWVKFNMREEFGDDSGDVIDQISFDYLRELTHRAYSWNWGHNPNIPVGYVEDSDDDEETEEAPAEDGILSKYEFDRDPKMTNDMSNAFYDLDNFLEEASNRLGWKVYPEAVIKLLRWGERKGTALKLDGFSYVFELGTNKAKNDIGSISDYQLQMINGKMYELQGWIVLSEGAADPKLKNIPWENAVIGAVLTSHFAKEDGNEFIVPTYYSMFDFIPLVKSGEITVEGVERNLTVTKNVGGIELDALFSDFRNDRDSFLNNPFWRSKELKQLCLKFKSKSTQEDQNLLMIFGNAMKTATLTNDIQKHKIKSLDDLNEKIQTFQIYSASSALNINLVSIMMPIIEAALVSEKPLLEAWDTALCNWKGLESFWDVAEPTQAIPAASTKLMDAFEKQTQPEAVMPATPQITAQSFNQETAVQTDSVEVASGLICSVPADAKIGPVVNLNGEVIGGYAKYSFMSKTSKKPLICFNLIGNREYEELKNSGTPELPSASIVNFLPRLLKDLENVVTGRTKSFPLVFASNESLKYYVTIAMSAINLGTRR